MISAHKIEEHYTSYFPDKDKSIWDGLQEVADGIEEKYNCKACKYVNDCKDGKYCYIDYLESNKRNGIGFPPPRLTKNYNYYYKDLGLI